MKQDLREIIRGLISEMFDEAVIKHHVMHRYQERIGPDELNVGYEDGTPTPTAETIKIVGKSSLDPSIKDEVLKRIKKIEEVNFEFGKTYGIKLYDIPIDLENVRYNSEQDKEDAKGKTLVYVVSDKGGYSVGNEVWVATDKSNNIPTLMLRRSYFSPLKRWDVVIDDYNKILKRQF